jgi:succinate dehydrogenase / fumarate reductase, cytochrome b subunit
MASAGTASAGPGASGAVETAPQAAAPVGLAASGRVIRNRGLWTALRYRGREGMWTWILHRMTGLGILAFLIIHVVETATVIYYPDIYDAFLASYKSPLFRVAELLIIFAVFYHALNGLRIIIQDFWPMLMQRQRQLTWAVAILTVLAMIPITWLLLAPLAGWRAEPGAARHAERCAEIPDAPACLHAPTHGTTGEVSL